MGELLQGRHRQQGVPGTRQLYSDAVAPVVAVRAQNQASKGRDLSTLASLRALRARTSEQAWTRRAVGEGVKSCPRAGCYAEVGGLMAYGISLRTLFIRAASFVKRILDGAKPGDLPVEQPTKIELVINLKTAKELGLSIPPT